MASGKARGSLIGLTLNKEKEAFPRELRVRKCYFVVYNGSIHIKRK
jgi:hypothetical protein